MRGTDITQAAAFLQQDQLVAIPTETVYGLAANALHEEAVARIFAAKNRPSFDPLIVHVAHAEAAFALAHEVPDAARILADAFWPGPLTLVLKKKDLVPDLVTSGMPTVGLRVPKGRLIRPLLESLPFPLAAPSANPFGYVSPTRPEHVEDQLGSRVAYILDDGPCAVGLESTIVDLSSGKPTILRLGGLSKEAIEEVLGHPVETKLSSSKPKAPGQLISHYAPRVKVIAGTLEQLNTLPHSTRNAWVTFKEEKSHPQAHYLSKTGNDQEAAARLFALLRQLDNPEAYDQILMEWAPEKGLGRAINDRLQRASSTSS